MKLCTSCLAGAVNILREVTINLAKHVPLFTNRTIDKRFTKNTANYVLLQILSAKPHTFPALAICYQLETHSNRDVFRRLQLLFPIISHYSVVMEEIESNGTLGTSVAWVLW